MPRKSTAKSTATSKKKAAPKPVNPQPVADESAARPQGRSRSTSRKFDKPVHPKAKITFRHNIMPPMLGILIFAGVLGLLNAQWLVAQYHYHFAPRASENTLAASAASVDPKAPPQISIPKINVTAPMVTNEKSYDNGRVQKALERGVVQYGAASADPGQVGNLVVVGHSSGQPWTPGNYKFVFTLLEKIGLNDRIFIDYKGTRYIYRVTSTKVVPPTDLSVLRPTDEPQLTLITCTPVGTSRDRFIVTARQVSPDPKTATPAKTDVSIPVTTEIPI